MKNSRATVVIPSRSTDELVINGKIQREHSEYKGAATLVPTMNAVSCAGSPT